ncbi:tetratricopeptide repeat (TPR)-like superfamily protein isoform X2 [Tasmannia lanceolata]|uniref:tetratricopeptide repeat (TPR)-like superfamily protein isoform X2 n=1 Tax=Tasmannia lanceolata TaxID=3420 RepID=UPI004063B91E
MHSSSISSTAAKLSRALISASTTSRSPHSLEQTLHHLFTSPKTLTPSLISNTIDPFLLSHPSLSLALFNWASQQPSFSHTPQTYNSLLKSLSLSHQSQTLEKLLKQMKTHKIPLNSNAYLSIITSRLLSGKPTNAFAAFAKLMELDCDINPIICNSLLAALASDGTSQLDKTLGLLDRIKQTIHEINGSIIAILIVDGLCRASRVSEAWWILEELRVRDCKPDFIAYRIVAESFRAMHRFEDADKVLKQKRKLGVAPRANDYREFIFGLITERRIREAKELGEAIISGDFPIEDDVLNALIGSVSGVDPDSAASFCKSMIEKDRFPSLFTLSNLSRNLCKNNKTDQMWDIFQVLSLKGYFSDLESYNVMVSFLCKAGRVKEAYVVLREMRKKGFGPDVLSYNSLLEALCREDLLRPAKRLWDEMFANGCRGNLQTYNTLIRKLSESGEVEEAQRLFHHMLEKGVLPDTVTYTSLIKGFSREAKIDTAYEIFKKSLEQDVILAGSTLSTLILSLCKEGNFSTASKVMRGLPLSEVDNTGSHVVLLKGLVDAGEVEMAVDHIKWVRDGSLSKFQAISTELISSLALSLNPKPILQLFHAMRERGLVSKNDPWFNLCEQSFDG